MRFFVDTADVDQIRKQMIWELSVELQQTLH